MAQMRAIWHCEIFDTTPVTRVILNKCREKLLLLLLLLYYIQKDLFSVFLELLLFLYCFISFLSVDELFLSAVDILLLVIVQPCTQFLPHFGSVIRVFR